MGLNGFKDNTADPINGFFERLWDHYNWPMLRSKDGLSHSEQHLKSTQA